MVIGLSKPLDRYEPFEFESDNKTAEVEINLQLSMQAKLARAIDKEINKFQITSNESFKHPNGINRFCFIVLLKKKINIEKAVQHLPYSTLLFPKYSNTK
jgi:hypothetical protein